jgi:hypothetical protein
MGSLFILNMTSVEMDVVILNTANGAEVNIVPECHCC